MKKKDKEELKTKDIAALKKIITDWQNELGKTKLELKMNKIKNVHLAFWKKKDIARAKTILVAKSFMGNGKEKKGGRSRQTSPSA